MIIWAAAMRWHDLMESSSGSGSWMSMSMDFSSSP